MNQPIIQIQKWKKEVSQNNSEVAPTPSMGDLFRDEIFETRTTVSNVINAQKTAELDLSSS